MTHVLVNVCNLFPKKIFKLFFDFIEIFYIIIKFLIVYLLIFILLTITALLLFQFNKMSNHMIVYDIWIKLFVAFITLNHALILHFISKIHIINLELFLLISFNTANPAIDAIIKMTSKAKIVLIELIILREFLFFEVEIVKFTWTMQGSTLFNMLLKNDIWK